MGKVEGGIATLLHDAKRCAVYEYGIKGVVDGKITISKRLMSVSDIDFIDALDARDIEIINCSATTSKIDLAGTSIDTVALSLATAIIDTYQFEGKLPEKVSK